MCEIRHNWHHGDLGFVFLVAILNRGRDCIETVSLAKAVNARNPPDPIH